ncbi:hypothetical protein E1287_27655 [Actinomadura sp. KC06]|nr:hypothetical protein E1287_27655 [Actinomadura sp. KC06]
MAADQHRDGQHHGVQRAGLDVLWVGIADSPEARVAESEGIRFAVATGKIRRASNPLRLVSPANVREMARMPLGVAQARAVIVNNRPDVVLATGGNVAVPVGLATRARTSPDTSRPPSRSTQNFFAPNTKASVGTRPS